MRPSNAGASARIGRITSIPGWSNSRATGPATMFDVPMRPSGANASPSSGQRKPSDRADTGAIGNSDRRDPRPSDSRMRRGAAKTISPPPSTTQRRDGCRTSAFQTASVRLERRAQDLQRLKAEHASTLSALEQARDEQSRLGEEVRLLSAELESLEARKAAARTREGVLAEGLDASGWSAARERIDAIRASLREQSKLLAYYEVERTELVDEPLATLPVSAQDPAQAIDEVLAAWPAR